MHKSRLLLAHYSFGAMTSYAFAQYMKEVYSLEPVHVFLSGASAPYVSNVTCALKWVEQVRQVQ